MSKQMNLVQFAEIISSTWLSKLKKISSIKNNPEYEVKNDYYKQIREYVRKFHDEGLTLDQFGDVTNIVANTRKQKTYAPLITAYKRFLKANKPFSYFKPQRGTCNLSDLQIKVNPELGLDLNGNKYLVKLYFKVEPLSKQSADIITWIMEKELRKNVTAETKMAVLDVARSKLYTAKDPAQFTSLAIEAEAKHISELWDSL